MRPGARILCVISVFLAAMALAAQLSQTPPFDTPTKRPGDFPGDPKDSVRLPNGKIQQDEILKAEHEKNLSEAKQLVELAKSLQGDLDQNGAQNVLSLGDIHKTEEIEKLAKRIRSRIKRN